MWLSLLLVASVIEAAVGSSGSAPVNLKVSMVTYLGDGKKSGINNGTGVAVDSDGNVYVVGSGPNNFGLKPEGNTSAEGYILKLESGKKPVNVYRIGNQMGRIRVRETKSGQRIMVLADTGVVVLNQTFGVVYQFAQTCNLTDCLADMGKDGMVGVVRRYEHVLEVYTDGQLTANKSFPSFDYSHHFMDVAMDPANKRFVLGYFYQSHPHGVPVQVPCVISYDYTLKQIWEGYCVSGDDDYDTQNMADSRCNQLFFSDVDNKLFMGGYNDGGNTIFDYNPADIAKNHQSTKGLKPMSSKQKPAYDAYTNTYGFHGAHKITFIARLDPKKGSVEEGQSVCARESTGDGNSVGTNAVAGGPGGILVAAQSAGSSIENRDNQTINNQKTAGYGGGDGVLLVVSGDFQKRLVWHQFHKTSGRSTGVAVAANSVKSKTRVAFLVDSADAEFLQINQLKGTGHAKGSTVTQTALVVLDL